MFNDNQDLAVDRHLIVTHRLRTRRIQLELTQKQVVSRLATHSTSGNWILGPDIPTPPPPLTQP